jgi:fumarylacetoacetase
VRARGGAPEPAARIGDGVLLLRALHPSLESLNALIERGPRFWEEVRHAAEGTGPALGLDEVEPVLPVRVTDFVDCYASLEHATNVGRMFRPEAPLAPNWHRLPVGYHGRASTILVSGTDVVRPCGQVDGHLRPTHALDFECELGFVCGPSTRVGDRVAVDEAEERIFGFVLLNDWSARDVQAFEYVPLGPFLGKSFATSISPWIVPAGELERVTPRQQDPLPDAYLRARDAWSLDLDIEVLIDGEPVALCNPRLLYWTPAQMLAHATVNGAALTAGDLFGTGTISGSTPDSLGCLLERHEGERWLADGEEVVLRADALGEVSGRILPARRL